MVKVIFDTTTSSECDQGVSQIMLTGYLTLHLHVCSLCEIPGNDVNQIYLLLKIHNCIVAPFPSHFLAFIEEQLPCLLDLKMVVSALQHVLVTGVKSSPRSPLSMQGQLFCIKCQCFVFVVQDVCVCGFKSCLKQTKVS